MDEFRKKYGLTATDSAGLMHEIKQKMAKIHPDRNGGEFSSDDEKKTFSMLSDAKDELERNMSNNQLIPIATVEKFLSLVGNRNGVTNEDALNTQLRSSISRYILKSKKKSSFPKISSTAIATIVSAIWLFPGVVKDHPILSTWIDSNSPTFSVAWLVILAIASTCWVIDYIRQNKIEDLTSLLQEEQFQNELFARFEYQSPSYNRNFTKSDFTNFITSSELKITDEKFIKRYFVKKGLFPNSLSKIGFGLLQEIDMEVAANVTESVIARAESRGVIKQSSMKGLSLLYEFIEQE